MTTTLTSAPSEEVDRLQTRIRKLAEEKANLHLIVRLIERLDPLSGLEDMVRTMLYDIVESIGGTNIKLYYWIDEELHYIDFLGERKTLETLDDALVAEVAERREFVESAASSDDALLRGDIVPGAWTWIFPLLVGQELIGVIKLENLNIQGTPLRKYLPTFFTHAALILSNEIRQYKREKAEAALRESEARYKRITEGLTDHLYTVRIEDGRVVETRQSPACETVTGYLPEDYAADPYLWIQMVVPEDRELVREHVRQILAGKDVMPLEHRIIRKDGKIRWISDTTISCKDAAGKLLSYDGVIRDITERKQAADALARSHAELQRFTEISAHHLQEPARRIAIYAERLTAQLAGRLDDEQARLSLEYIGQQARRQQTLLRDIERYLAASQPRGEVGNLDVRKTVGGILAKMADHLRQAGAAVTLGNLPAVRIDLPRLNDLFAVTLDNALKFGHSEAPLCIAIEGELQGNRVRYSVADNGPGIEEAYRERVFRVFERLATTGEGTGIGLAILRRVAESTGGRAWIEEAPGGGCRVLFDLPAGETP